MKLSIGYRYFDERNWPHWHIVVNGKRFSREAGYVFQLNKTIQCAFVYSPELMQALSDFPVGDLITKVTDWNFCGLLEWHALSVKYELEHEIPERRRQQAKITFEFDSDHWNYPWSVTEFGRTFIRVAAKYQPVYHCDFVDDELPVNGLNIILGMPSLSSTVGSELARARELVIGLYDEARRDLIIASREASLVTFFDFPEEHRTACKQYLIFFADFLKALGISARTELVDDLPKVLFTVTPEDGKAALEKVRTALSLYLRFPDRTPDTESLNHTDPEIRKLAQSVQALRENVLKNSEVHLIDAATNVGSGGIVQADVEAFWGGRLVLKKWGWGPFEINFPCLLRELKARFPLLKRLE